MFKLNMISVFSFVEGLNIESTANEPRADQPMMGQLRLSDSFEALTETHWRSTPELPPSESVENVDKSGPAHAHLEVEVCTVQPDVGQVKDDKMQVDNNPQVAGPSGVAPARANQSVLDTPLIHR